MYKFGIVILHYLSLKETVLLIDEIINSEAFGKLNIYVVDNGSFNNSGKELLKKYRNFKNIKIILNDKNLGFAKGNNLGIARAIKDGCDFVICSNNDIEVKITDKFLNKIIEVYETDRNIAVVGPRILTKSGEEQNPLLVNRPKFNTLKARIIYTTKVGKILYYLKNIYVFPFISKIKRKRNIIKENLSSGYVYALHGSFLIFTPTFFKHFQGFDEGTFLYGEEIILAEMLYRKNLKSYFLSDIEVLHKEDVSTDFFLKTFNKNKLKFIVKNNYRSFSYFYKKYIFGEHTK